MTEQIMRELLTEEGLTEEVARLRDRDLWLLHPGARFDDELTGEEGVRAWEEAAGVAQAVAETISNGPGTIQAGPAITMLVWDAQYRAEEALRRARERAEHPEMRATVFGEVLAELLEKRGFPVTPLEVSTLSAEAGLDGQQLLGRMADTGVDAGHLDGLADALDLTQEERKALALAYSLERRQRS